MTNKLEVTLPSDREVRLTRTFDAPRDLVFEACTKPEYVRQWWGRRGSEMIVCEMDVRPGGMWRYVVRDPDGSDYGFHGEYREVVRPERVVQTSVFEPMPDFEAVETAVFTEEDGRTTLTTTVVHPSKEARDGYLQSGMEEGAGETLDRLEELLATLR